MNITAGSMIKSAPSLDDPNFEDTIIYIFENNRNGAVGFVINKPLGRMLNELTEFKSCPAFPIYDGGPVDKEHLFFIHRQPALVTGGRFITDGVYFGGDFGKATTHLKNGTIDAKDIKLFVGYCGWDFNQLNEEMIEGSWQMLLQDDGYSLFSG